MPSLVDYDRVPYPSVPLAQTHPDRLATMGRLFGLDTAAPERCRYLELGCGSGMNILCMAALLPEARFVGVDLAREPIAIAQGHAAELKLTNVEFIAADLATLGQERALGEFDYIVAHGVYSWVPPPVADALMQLCAARLTAQGVAYISYNTMPGGHLRMMTREMMRYHTRDLDRPQERVAQGRSLLQFLITARCASELNGALLQAELDSMDLMEPEVITHDDLSEHNHPCYVSDFLAHAGRQQLQFLAEADLSAMQDLSFPPQVRELLGELRDDPVAREQYFDFLTCRRFRQTLLCRAEARLDRGLTPLSVLEGLGITGTAQLTARATDAASGEREWTFRRKPNLSFSTRTASTAALLELLGAAWPRTLRVVSVHEQLTAQGHAVTMAELCRELWHLALLGCVDLRSWAFPAPEAIGTHPRVGALARWRAASSVAMMPTLHHQLVQLDGVLLPALVRLLDGSRTLSEAIAALAAEVRAGRIPVPPGLDAQDTVAVRAALTTAVAPALAELRRLVLLEA